MNDFTEYRFSHRPFIVTGENYRSGDRVYSLGDFASFLIDDADYPLEHRTHGHFGEAQETRIMVVPLPMWAENQSFGNDFETRLIELKTPDAHHEAPQPPPPSSKHGYRLIATGCGVRTKCPRCSSEMTKTGSSHSYWVSHYSCKCGGVLDHLHRDMDGVDAWKYFEPFK